MNYFRRRYLFSGLRATSYCRCQLLYYNVQNKEHKKSKILIFAMYMAVMSFGLFSAIVSDTTPQRIILILCSSFLCISGILLLKYDTEK